jgi:hypothetical protein
MSHQGNKTGAEQGLANYETCVSYDTRIQTRDGAKIIGELIGKEVEVFNGERWSTVIPFKTGKDILYRVTFSDGSILDANATHEFSVKYNKSKAWKKVKLFELLPEKHSLPKFELPFIEGDCEPIAYTLGAFTGDGYVDQNNAIIFTPESKYSLIDNYLPFVSTVGKEQSRPGLEPTKRVYLNLNIDLAKSLRDREVGLPNAIMNYNSESALEFMAGVIDTDGSVRQTNGVQSYAIYSTSLAKLRDMQILLRRGGINSTSIVLQIPKENKGNKGRNFDLYSLAIYTFECSKIPTRLKIATNFGPRYKVNNAYPNGALVDSAKVVRVVRIDEIGEAETYCFHEKGRNMGVFNNVLTHQCCLSEVVLPNIESKEELLDVVELLYKVNKHALRLPAPYQKTEEIVHKNMRMGIGITGYLQASEEQKSWLSDCYEYIRDFDNKYSEINRMPKSVKLTTVKPSGSLSLLPGVTPGAHPAYARYMYRRIRVAASHILVDICRKNGYPVEYVKRFDGTEDYGTVVITFPYSYPEGTRLAKDMTALDQLKVIKELQTNWSDNSVSCTIYYRKEELPAIQEYLSKHYKNGHKTLSFLLHSEHGFIQAPYEEITKEQYDNLVANTKPITSLSEGLDLDESDIDCATGACPIR